MKTILCVLAVILSSSFAVANSLNMDPNGPSLAQVKAVQAQITPNLLKPGTGVNGVGITACESKSGLAFYDIKGNLSGLTFVNCLDISTETKEAAAALKSKYSTGSKYQGIYVSIHFVGRIIAQ